MRTAYLLVGAVVVLAVGALAVPALFPSDPDGELAVATTDPSADAGAADVSPSLAAGDAAAVPPVAAIPAPTGPVPVATSAEGDLRLDLVLGQATVVSGARVKATLRFVNTNLRAMHIPAAGEPHPTLAIVVLDQGGNEIRRVVESSADPYPRRMFELKPGAAMDLAVLVVGADDEALPPGEYTVAAEFRRDPVWDRLGLTVWDAPKGPIRTAQERLVVVAAETR